MANEDLQRIWIGVNDEAKRQTEKRDTGMIKVA
jgi:hypothetical protein